MSEKETISQEKGSIIRWFSNPWVGIIGALASIVGIPLAIYLYFSQQEKAELVYYVNPGKTLILEYGRMSDLDVFYKNQKITSDLTAAQILIWNAGNKSIHKENILSEIKILTDPPVNILEAQVIKTSRAVINFNYDSTMLVKGIVPISWKILEQNDGASLQMIYQGSRDVIIKVEGIVEGQPEVYRLEPIEDTKSSHDKRDSSFSREKSKTEKILKVFTFIWYLLSMIFLLFVTVFVFREARSGPKYFYIIGIFLALMVLVGFFAVYSKLQELNQPAFPTWL
jgi:hypothetical protein